MESSENLSSPSSGTSSRKRPRENETDSQRQKREKAAERQRRKRERDKGSNGSGIDPFSTPGPPGGPPPAGADIHQQHHHQQMQQHDARFSASPYPLPHQDLSQEEGSSYSGPPQDPQLSPEENARRERVRASARERQRKHRAAVKQRKLRDLGMDMGNEVISGIDEAQFRPGEGPYPPVLPHELQHVAQHAISAAAGGQLHEPPFPHGQAHGGQTFATTLLLSFSCAPLLKTHLLRTLNMTNEELASLEPVIADAWDHWDHQRRMHYEHTHGAGPPFGDPAAGAPNGNPFPPAGDNEFRGRFHRSIVGPTPFQTVNSAVANNDTPPPAQEAIDPNLANAATKS
ncbi:hypothetical protein C8J56DRAFT_440485 [Mycena floridula]|nr:hypothetical protein C8J56DRAFT_440485 [Mycena floridula]